jgi:Flp pilus assembly protein TadG
MEPTAKTAPRPIRTSRRAGSRKGSELLEFTFAFLPLTAMLILLVDASWAMYVKSTLAYAVHEGVRQGITIDASQATGTTLTAMVQNIVQQNAQGMLAGSGGLSLIHVNYFRVSSTNSSQLTTVTQAGGGLMPGDIIEVSVQGYSLPALFPRIYNWKSAADDSASSISAVAADRIEPFTSLPSI